MKIKLDVMKGSSEVQRVIRELRQYKEDLRIKNELFVERLAEIGCDLVNEGLADAGARIPHDTPIGTAVVERGETGDTVKMKVVVESSLILFIEFGTGIRYAGTQNPKAGELGYGPGTYPGKGHWDDPNGWVYQDANGNYHHTYGIRARMPMYNASVEMQNRILEVAREVFGD